MRKSFRFKLFQNHRKNNKLRRELWVFCQIYNHSLALIKRHYKIFGKNPTKNNLQKHLKRLMDRGLHPEWKELGYSQGIQEVTDRIYKSYDAFFKWCKIKKGVRKSPPKFKPFRKYKSFTLKQAGWKLEEENGRILIGKTWFRYNKSRNIQGVPKTLNIKRDPVGDWFITISCDLGDDFIPEKIAPRTGQSAGFDFGLKCFLISNDGEEHASGTFLKANLNELRRRSSKFSKKIKGSKNRKKAGKSLARLHRKIADKRLDSHFKLALDLIRTYDNLFFEDLNLNGMKKLWGRKVSDHAFATFMKIIEFKATEHKKTIHKVDRFYPSSKTCSNPKCGHVKKELTLKERVFVCDKCGLKIPRDLNASINIHREGASSLGLGGVSPDLGLVFAV